MFNAFANLKFKLYFTNQNNSKKELQKNEFLNFFDYLKNEFENTSLQAYQDQFTYFTYDFVSFP